MKTTIFTQAQLLSITEISSLIFSGTQFYQALTKHFPGEIMPANIIQTRFLLICGAENTEEICFILKEFMEQKKQMTEDITTEHICSLMTRDLEETHIQDTGLMGLIQSI